MDNDKPYTIETEIRGDYVWALIGGERLTASIAAEYWDEIAETCKQANCEKILLEKDFRIPVAAEDMIKMSEHVATVLPKCRIAFYDRWHHDTVNELGKRLARNRDIKMQLFSDVAEAEKWLRAN